MRAVGDDQATPYDRRKHGRWALRSVPPAKKILQQWGRNGQAWKEKLYVEGCQAQHLRVIRLPRQLTGVGSES